LLLIEGVLDREQPLVLGIEEDDQAEENGEEAGVEQVVLGAGGLVEEGGAVALGGGLEAVQEDIEGLEDLLGQLVGDIGLAPAAGSAVSPRISARNSGRSRIARSSRSASTTGQRSSSRCCTAGLCRAMHCASTRTGMETTRPSEGWIRPSHSW